MNLKLAFASVVTLASLLAAGTASASVPANILALNAPAAALAPVMLVASYDDEDYEDEDWEDDEDWCWEDEWDCDWDDEEDYDEDYESEDDYES